MQADRLTEFEQLLGRGGNPLGTSVLMVLAWIAASDRDVATAERRQLEQIARASEHGSEIETLIRCALQRDLGALQLACEVVREHFLSEKAALFIEMAIGMVVADSYLRPAENYILRFIADLLNVDRRRLNELFIETTGREIPEPSDPSIASFWRAKADARRRANGDGDEGAGQSSRARPTRDHRARNSYAVLGLEYGASLEDVKRAYRRMAQVHHPDKYASLGKEAVAAATSTFQRIQEAYQYLVSNA